MKHLLYKTPSETRVGPLDKGPMVVPDVTLSMLVVYVVTCVPLCPMGQSPMNFA